MTNIPTPDEILDWLDKNPEDIKEIHGAAQATIIVKKQATAALAACDLGHAHTESEYDLLVRENKTLVSDIQASLNKGVYLDHANKINVSKNLFQLRQVMEDLCNSFGIKILINIPEPSKGYDQYFTLIRTQLKIDDQKDTEEQGEENKQNIYSDTPEQGILLEAYPVGQADKSISKILNSDQKNSISIFTTGDIDPVVKENLIQLREILFEKLQFLSTVLYNSKRAIESPLTHMFNKDWFDSYGNRLFELTKRHNKSFGVFMCDIDNFKGVNTAHGHLVGDDVIKKIGDIWKDIFKKLPATRIVDEDFGSHPSHWGGDESAGIFVNLDEGQITKVVEAFIKELSLYELFNQETGESLNEEITVSMGVAHLDAKKHDGLIAPDFKSFMIHANISLFKSKIESKELCRDYEKELKTTNKQSDELGDEIRSVARGLDIPTENASLLSLARKIKEIQPIQPLKSSYRFDPMISVESKAEEQQTIGIRKKQNT